ncbi:MAG: mechanosensitive ion channel domain-containing protein [Pseudomonadota bacterium]
MRAGLIAVFWCLLLFATSLVPTAQAQILPGQPTAEADAGQTPQTDALTPLIEALEDPEARERLLAALRAEGEVIPEEAAAVEENPRSTQALASRLAEASSDAVNDVVERVSQVLRDVQRLGVLPSLLTEERRATIASEGLALLLTVLATVAIYRSLRILSRRIRIASTEDGASFGQMAGVFAIQFTLRVASVLLAWVAGYGLGTFVLSDGTLALSQALYLNAFLIFGGFSVALSVLVSRHPDDLTFAKLPPQVEGVIYRQMRLVFGLLFYGLVAAVPISQTWTNFVISRSLRTVILTIVAILAILAIRRIARALRTYGARVVETVVAEGDEEETLTDSLAEGSLNLWDRVWPWLAYLYVVVAYTMSLANPNQMVELVGRATLFSAVALVLVLVALRLLSFASRDLTFPLPRVLNAALPTLSPRLSTFLPALSVVGGVVLTLAAFLMAADGWRLIAVDAWLSGMGSDLIWRLVSVVLILASLGLAWAILTSWIDRKLSLELTGKEVSARSRTLLALFRNAVTIALVIFGGMIALSELGIDIAPLLAGAGVIGLAVGFGAQKLVQDIITGIFIQLENAINEGDVVTVAGITGGVERLTIRSVGIRDLSGVYHLIPFSAVDTVGNYMRLFAYHVEVVGVAYDTDLDLAEKTLHEAFDVLKAGPLGQHIIAPLEYHGVVGLADSSVNLRVRIKTKPGQQWAVGRSYTREVKRALDAAGIEIPFPHRELKLPEAMVRRLTPPMTEPAKAEPT